MGHWRLLLKNWLIKVSSFMMWCNLVDMKRKQGFLECKHAALNIWKAVLRLDWTELCLALGFSVDPAGVGPTELVCFRLLCSLFDLFHCWQNDLFGSEEVVFWTWLDCSYLAVLSLLFWFYWVILCCVAVLCIGWIPRALTVPVECNRIPSCHLCLPSHVGTVRVA